MPQLQIRLLGDFYLAYDSQPLAAINTPRLQALLAYLLLHSHAAQSRQYLAYLFWPDSSEAQAHTNLRNLLHLLRHTLPEPDTFLGVDSMTLQWISSAPYTLDVDEFQQAIANAWQAESEGDPVSYQAFMQDAISLYHGDLLPSCYEDWIISERERLRQVHIDCLEQLTQFLEQRREFAKATRYARILVNCDPLREAGYRTLMRLYSSNGERASALRAFHSCTSALQRELGVEPSAETTAAYQSLISGDGPKALLPRQPTPLAVLAAPLVGRRQEWNLLLEAWHSLDQGQSRFVLILGEAGIGKTRLAEELVNWLESQGVATATACCHGAFGEVAFAPPVAWLRTRSLYDQIAMLSDSWLTELARLLPELLSEHPHLPHPEPLAESRQRQRIFEALSRAIRVGNRPYLLVLDNLQWCDRETLSWLQTLLQPDSAALVLVVATMRDDEVTPNHPAMALIRELRRSSSLMEIEVSRLNPTETSTLASRIANAKIDPSVAERLFLETEGNPLFVVEMVRAALHASNEGDRRAGRDLVLPSQLPLGLQAVIEARLMHLSPGARELLGLAATIGREFTYDVLLQASDLDEQSLVRYLDEAWQCRVISERGTSAYDFSHDKIRQIAYLNLSKSRRRSYHRRIAKALELVYSDTMGPISGRLAVHYEQAGRTMAAVQSYRRAAEYANSVGAYVDAVGYVDDGLRQLAGLPQTPEHAEREIELLLTSGSLQIATKGYAAAEVQQVYERAESLCQQIDHSAHLHTVRVGLMMCHIVRSELRLARSLGEQLLDSASLAQDVALLLEAHIMLGITLFYMGEFTQAREHLRAGIDLYNPQLHGTHASVYGQDPDVAGLSFLGLTLWFLGYPNQALDTIRAAVELSRRIGHSYSLGMSLFALGWLHQLRHEVQAAHEVAVHNMELCSERGFVFWLALANGLHSWVLAEKANPKQGLIHLEQNMREFADTGARLSGAYWLGLLAGLHHKMNQSAKGLAAVSTALAVAEASGERFYEAELWRLEAELLLARPHNNQDEAETRLQRALTIAQHQKAKSLELRVWLSLSRLHLAQDRQESTRQKLAECYAWFNEGLDTPDLLDAKAVLAALP